MASMKSDIIISEWQVSLYWDKKRRWIYGNLAIHADCVTFRPETLEPDGVTIPYKDIDDIRKALTWLVCKAIYIVKKNGDKVWFSSLSDRKAVFGTLVHFWRTQMIPDSGTSSGSTVVQEEHRESPFPLVYDKPFQQFEKDLRVVPVKHHVSGSGTPFAKAIQQKDTALIFKLVQENVCPSQQDLQLAMTYLKEDDLERMTDTVKQYIQNQSMLIKNVRATFVPGDVKEVVFVAFTTTTDKINISLPYTVVFRKIDDYSSEGAEVTYSNESLRKPFTKQESERINAALQKHSENLMDKHKNVQMISACPVISKKFGSFDAKIIPKACIVIYVDFKGLVPIGEKTLPKYLDTVPVDVREGGPRLLSKQAPDDVHKHLSMGCQIASDFGAGTLCGFLDNPVTGKLYCLTCAHVVVKPEDFAQRHDDTVSFQNDFRKVYQPYPNPLYQIGHVEKAIFKKGDNSCAGVDVALVSVTNTDRCPLTGEFPTGNYHATGFTDQRPMVYTSGDVYTRDTLPDQFESRSEVIKFGSSSGPTRGSFLLNGTSVRRRDIQGTEWSFGFELHNQIEVLSIDPANNGPFAKQGDSGSLVFFPHKGNCSDLRAIGILEAATFNNTFVITPIWDVLQALNMPLKLKSFPLHEQQESCISASFASMSFGSDDMEVQQAASTNVNLNSEIRELHSKMDQMSDELHNRISKTEEMNKNTEEVNKTRHDEVMMKLSSHDDVMVKLNSLLDRSSNQ